MIPQKPLGYEEFLSNYQVVLFDGWCGEPIAWGFKITHHLGEERFENLRRYNNLYCAGAGSWVVIIKTLTRQEAIEKYGAITEEVFGARGGWKSATFGQNKFLSTYLRPEKTGR